jgi:HEAT repeat protein
MYPLIAVALTLSLAGSFGTRGLKERYSQQSQRVDAGGQRVRTLVGRLWSASDAERSAAKRELGEAGSEAIQPLLSLLTTVTSDMSPRFPIGKEAEGEEALTRVTGSTTFADSAAAFQKVRELAINARLRNDAVELLGRLRSVEAVPILIRMMAGHGTIVSRLSISVGPESLALANIGRPAVPLLLEALDRPEGVLRSAIPVEYILEGPSFETVNKGGLPGLSDPGKKAPQAMTPEGGMKSQVQALAAYILGEIGDASALTLLDSLARTSKDEYLVRYLRKAAKKIRAKAHQ